MSAWKDSDEVTTTYGSIQLSLEQAHSAGIKTEQERIIKLLKAQKVCPCCCFNDDCRWKAAKKELIALIKGEKHESI